MLTRTLALAAALFSLLLAGCVSHPGVRYGGNDDYSPTMPEAVVPPEHNHGGIFQAANASNLFEDYKARRVGDVLNVILDERTNARKSSNASSSKESGVSLANPTIAGRPTTYNGIPLFGASIEGSRSFEGGSDAEQSNLLEGSVTVTVREVLPNGNLVVAGEKWVRINQGEEYVRLRGIVRPVDIRADNSVLSTKVANAQVAYGGTGTLSHSSSPGWATRFFNSPLWPF